MIDSLGLSSQLSSNVLHTMHIIHGTHDPLLDILKQFLLLAINTFQYQVQLLVPVGLFTRATPYMILAYHFWHFYASHLPLVSQGNWVSFYSTLLLLPFGCSPEVA